MPRFSRVLTAVHTASVYTAEICPLKWEIFMDIIAGVLGLVLLVTILWDGFETIVLPRRVTRKLRLARVFFRVTWRIWSGLVRLTRTPRRRDRYLSIFGPLSLLMLLAMWAAGMIVAFALLHLGCASRMKPPGEHDFGSLFYMSGTTFITLGMGDVAPVNGIARVLTVLEGGTGFAFLALVIGYLPVIYQAFSRREAKVAQLDARAGSPATASELIRRYARAAAIRDLDRVFAEWEGWAADQLESLISYPVLAYFRSQHDNQSWLASLTTVMDACAAVIAGLEGPDQWQAHLTFAMGRHAVVDVAQILNTPPRAPDPDRLPAAAAAKFRDILSMAGANTARRNRLRGEAGGTAPHVRTLREFAVRLPASSAAPVRAHGRYPGQLAHQRVGAQFVGTAGSDLRRLNRGRPCLRACLVLLLAFAAGQQPAVPAARRSPRK